MKAIRKAAFCAAAIMLAASLSACSGGRRQSRLVRKEHGQGCSCDHPFLLA
ncbi:hypothetical protein BN871_JP_00070 [Paenibacillus sp. P22]|nr:hypothetical protein BN871_JP_00070 [Paenibacillus sp. P22]